MMWHLRLHGNSNLIPARRNPLIKVSGAWRRPATTYQFPPSPMTPIMGSPEPQGGCVSDGCKFI
ncbi:hypothetical protein PAXRUDRAFT_829356, partial [Paxillus rubicundulus Ve08.2h10]